MKTRFNSKVKKTIGAFILTLVFILIEYFNGGVATHYFLASDEMPGLSNWWGLLTIPVLTWIILSLIYRRQEKASSEQASEEDKTKVQKGFLVAVVFGIIMSILWEFDQEHILQYLIFTPVVIALFRPVHLPEYFLGFVIGMIFTFGGILPILFGLILLILSFVVNKIGLFVRGMITTKVIEN